VIASRYLPATAVMLALALVPTIVHSYVGFTAFDGKRSRDVASQLAGLQGVDTGRRAVWVIDNFGTDDFIERRYGADVTLFVARSYDPKRLYHHPELGVAYGRRFDSTSVVQEAAGSRSVPLHVLSGEDELACYALLYDDRFVESPLRFEAGHIFTTLASPRRQMTLFFARGPVTSKPMNSPAVRVLLAAIDSFLTQAPTGSQ